MQKIKHTTRDKMANSDRLPNGEFLRSFKTTGTSSFFQYAVVSLVISLAKNPHGWSPWHFGELYTWLTPWLHAAPRRHLVDAVSDEGVVHCAVVISAHCDGLVPPPQRY